MTLENAENAMKRWNHIANKQAKEIYDLKVINSEMLAMLKEVYADAVRISEINGDSLEELDVKMDELIKKVEGE